jgi:hypothetical protein
MVIKGLGSNAQESGKMLMTVSQERRCEVVDMNRPMRTVEVGGKTIPIVVRGRATLNG